MLYISDASVYKKENRMMKILKMRWRPILFVVCVATLILLLYHTVKYKYDCKGPYWELRSLQHLQRYCNPVSITTLGMEGEVPSSSYELVSVHTLIRHGDRYSMHTLPNYQMAKVNCQIDEDLKREVPGVGEYVLQMERLAARGGRGTQQTFHGYNLYPNSDSCKVAQLTPTGAAQHVKNGHHLRGAYLEKWNLVSAASQWDQVMVRSTTKSRTFQSSLALMTGLLGDLDLEKLVLQEALNNTMCSEQSGMSCHCLKSEELIDQFSPNYHQTSPHVMAQSSLQPALVHFADILGVAQNNLPRLTHLLDVDMIHYCHRLPLPNRLAKCIQPWALNDINRAVEANGRAQHSDANLQKIVRLKLQPLMYEIANRMNDQINGKSPLKFVLYSGHDSTIEPFANALGYGRGVWSRYAARIILELYRSKNVRDGGSFRVLSDGEVVTGDVSFCRGKLSDDSLGLCPLEHFLQFVNGGNIKDLGEESYEKACEKDIHV